MFRTGEGVETLSVFLKDAGGLVVELRYSVYEAEDLITRTAVYTNAGTQSLTLHKAASLSVDFAPDALELITLNGTWAAERTLERAALRCGIRALAVCGASPATPTTRQSPSAMPIPTKRPAMHGDLPLCTAATTSLRPSVATPVSVW